MHIEVVDDAVPSTKINPPVAYQNLSESNPVADIKSNDGNNVATVVPVSEPSHSIPPSQQMANTSNIVSRLLRNIGSFSLSNIIYYGGIFGGSAMVSRLRPNDPTFLAAMGLITTTEMFTLHTIWAAQYSTSITISFLPPNNEREAGVTLQQSLIYSTLIGAPISIILWNIGPISLALRQSSEISSLMEEYYQPFLYGAGVLPFVWLGAYEQFTLGIRDLRTVISIATLYVGSYLTMAYPLIYGEWGVRARGLGGLGLARTIAAATTFLAITANFALCRSYYRVYEIFTNHGLRTDRLYDLFSMGTDIAIQVGSELLGLYFLTVIAGHIDNNNNNNTVLGATNVNIQYLNMLVILPVTLAQSVGIEIGTALATTQNRQEARLIGNIGMRLSLILPTITTLLCVGVAFSSAFRSAVFSPFIDTQSPDNQEVIRTGGYALLINNAIQLADGVRNTAGGALRGYRDTRAYTLVSIFCMAGLTVFFAWLFGMEFGLGAAGLAAARVLPTIGGTAVVRRRWSRVSDEANPAPTEGVSIVSYIGSFFNRSANNAPVPGAAPQVTPVPAQGFSVYNYLSSFFNRNTAALPASDNYGAVAANRATRS